MNKFFAAALSASALMLAGGVSAAQAATYSFTYSGTDGVAGWSFDVISPAGNISYDGGPVQTWPNQANTSILPSLWADFAQTGGALTGDTIFFEGNYPNAEAATVTATTAFYSTGATSFPSGDHTFENLSFNLADGQTEVLNVLQGGTLTISATPEPAAWALMMVAVGGMGVALRTRRRLAPAKA